MLLFFVFEVFFRTFFAFCRTRWRVALRSMESFFCAPHLFAESTKVKRGWGPAGSRFDETKGEFVASRKDKKPQNYQQETRKSSKSIKKYPKNITNFKKKRPNFEGSFCSHFGTFCSLLRVLPRARIIALLLIFANGPFFRDPQKTKQNMKKHGKMAFAKVVSFTLHICGTRATSPTQEKHKNKI